MGYIKNIILFHSAGFKYEKIAMDGHLAFAGKNDVGKTALAIAMAYPFLIDNNLIYGRGDRGRDVLPFEKFYLDQPDSIIFYDAVSVTGDPFTFAIHRDVDTFWEFIPAPFDEDWVVGAASWAAVRTNIMNANVPIMQHVTTQTAFRSILHGFDARRGAIPKSWRTSSLGMSRFALFTSDAGRNSVSTLLSHVFQKNVFTQQLLRHALIEAAMVYRGESPDPLSAPLPGSVGARIDLQDAWNVLMEFRDNYDDIQLMTQPDPKTGLLRIQDTLDKVFEVCNEYHARSADLSIIPRRIRYAMDAAETRCREIDALLAEKYAEKEEMIATYEENKKTLDRNSHVLSEEEGELRVREKRLAEVKARYKNEDIDVLLHESANEESFREQLEQARRQRDMLASSHKDIANAAKDEKLAIAALDKVYHESVAELADKKTKAEQSATEDLRVKKKDIETAYAARKADLAEQEQAIAQNKPEDILSVVCSRAHDNERIITVNQVRRRFNVAVGGEADMSLAGILDERGLRDIDPAAAATKEENASSAMLSYIASKDEIRRRMTVLDRDENTEIEAARSVCRRRIGEIKKEYDDGVIAARDMRDAAIEETKTRFRALVSGDNADIANAIAEADLAIKDLTDTLSHLRNFPSLKADKDVLLGEASLAIDRRDHIQRMNTLGVERKRNDQEYDSLLKAFAAEENRLRNEKNDLRHELSRASDNINGEFGDIDVVDKEETDMPLRRLNDDFVSARHRLREMDEKGEVRLAVQQLYEPVGPDKLSRTDTFELGIQLQDTLASTENYLAVAERLQRMFRHDSAEYSIAAAARAHGNRWYSILRNTANAVEKMETMKSNIQKLCVSVNRFIRQNNNTNCVDRVELSFVNSDNIEIYQHLLALKTFFDENSTLIGPDNIFAVGSDVNERFAALLDGFSNCLKMMQEKTLDIEDMFAVRITLDQKGQTKVIDEFQKNGSTGTTILTKMMLVMALCREVLGRQKNKTAIPILLDEMNNIDHENLGDIIKFADQAGFVVIMTGMIPSRLPKYVYNVRDLKREVAGHVEMMRWIRPMTFDMTPKPVPVPEAVSAVPAEDHETKEDE